MSMDDLSGFESGLLNIQDLFTTTKPVCNCGNCVERRRRLETDVCVQFKVDPDMQPNYIIIDGVCVLESCSGLL